MCPWQQSPLLSRPSLPAVKVVDLNWALPLSDPGHLVFMKRIIVDFQRCTTIVRDLPARRRYRKLAENLKKRMKLNGFWMQVKEYLQDDLPEHTWGTLQARMRACLYTCLNVVAMVKCPQ